MHMVMQRALSMCYVYSLRVESAPALMSHGWWGWNTISSTPVVE